MDWVKEKRHHIKGANIEEVVDKIKGGEIWKNTPRGAKVRVIRQHGKGEYALLRK